MLGVRSYRRRAPRARGFTLPELLTVVAIVGVLATVAMVAMSNSSSAQDTASLARSLQFTLLRARNESMSDGNARKIECIPAATDGGCKYYIATSRGVSPLGWSTVSADDIHPYAKALVWNITYTDGTGSPSSGDTTAHAGTTQASGTFDIIFYPNGVVSSGASPSVNNPTGATIYVCDKTQQHKYKLWTWRYTGLTKMVDVW
jgi:prepilin-type N-terminal cleavage/methylation domain-containing protein